MLVREQAARSVPRDGSAAALDVALVLFVAALTAAAGRFSLTLPLTPVPITLQPVVVLAAAAVFGARLGLLGQVSFLAAGMMGLPVFADSLVLPPGPLRVLGPTGGYLLSYPFAALATGVLVARLGRFGTAGAFLAMASGLAIVYAVGIAWIAALGHAAAGPGAIDALTAAVATGLLPFLALDVVKLAIAARLVPVLRRRMTREP
jgi:biotin transport system substrate-specific component